MRLVGRTALVTGAGSGIGRAIAGSLAKRGCHLVLTDVNEDGLMKTADLVREYSIRVTCYVHDVSDRDAVANLPMRVAVEHPTIDLLFNNAGVALGGTFDQVSEVDFEWLFEINFWGVVRMTRAFLPMLHASDDARIINISSVYGLIAPPEQVAYSASKFAVRGFSESLRHELEGSNIGVTVVHPGGVATAISDNARVPAGANEEEVKIRREKFKKLLRLPPEVAGEIIVSGVEQRSNRVLVGSDAKIIALLVRLVPVSYWKVLKFLMGL